MNYDVWFNAGHGEDRRRIETEVMPVEDTSFKWLCQAAHQGSSVQQAMIMKYRVTDQDPSPPPETSDDGKVANKSGATTVGTMLGFVLLLLASVVMF